MRRIAFFTVVISGILSLNNSYGEEILNLRWGEEPHNINYFTVPDGRYGITDFYVDGEEICILDLFNYEIHIFNNSKYNYSVRDIPPETSFLERRFNKTYLFTRDSLVYQIRENTPVLVQRFDKINNVTSVLFFNNIFYPIYNYEKYADKNILMDAIIENPHLAQIRVYENNDVRIYSFSPAEEIAAITPVGILNELMVVLVEYSGGSRRDIKTIDHRGNIFSSIELPRRFFLSDVKEVKIFDDRIYILATSTDGVTLYRFNY